ncbi:hypothetical protein [Streptomyces sp. NBC_00847]|uniref:hypothetical protein n=1 Tax=Streptomyces sp. NBC_00847 TaxID=2975850 RepID=UPI00225DDEF1|nr:hypothetical protein [Streptomyces sp. NBC_00847]MCX4885869.1 hypothetical protein [Streptomyces sp. NBC_00847]
MAKLVKAVHVKDPDRNRMILLLPGEEPEPRIAALITNPDAWEDGQVPAAAASDSQDASDDGAGDGSQSSDSDTEDTPKAAPAAKKTAARKTAATKPARGRDAAEKGDSGA